MSNIGQHRKWCWPMCFNMIKRSKNMKKKKNVEMWVLTKPFHLGLIKQSFVAGTEIEFFPDERMMMINGETYKQIGDFMILKKHGIVIPKDSYDEQVDNGDIEEEKPVIRADIKPNTKKMVIERSDEDEMGKSIDISHTKNNKRVVDTKNNKGKKVEVIKGDESPEARREAILSKKMKVVKDDSLGDVAELYKPRNAGQVKTVTKEDAVKLEKVKKSIANRYKGKPDSGEGGEGVKAVVVKNSVSPEDAALAKALDAEIAG